MLCFSARYIWWFFFDMKYVTLWPLLVLAMQAAQT